MNALKLSGLIASMAMVAGAASAAPATISGATITDDGSIPAQTRQFTLTYTSSTFPAAAQTVTVQPRGGLKVYCIGSASTPSITIVERSSSAALLRSQTIGCTSTTGNVVELYDPIGFSKVSISPTTVPSAAETVSVTVLNSVTGRTR